MHSGRLEMEFGDGSRHTLGPGGMAWVDAATVRAMRNDGPDEAVYVIVGADDGYVGRDGRCRRARSGSRAPSRPELTTPTRTAGTGRPGRARRSSRGTASGTGSGSA